MTCLRKSGKPVTSKFSTRHLKRMESSSMDDAEHEGLIKGHVCTNKHGGTSARVCLEATAIRTWQQCRKAPKAHVVLLSG